ncbi:MAG: hypothetical protein RPR97_17820 [Colwellia sp.]|jgi:hypothetical protein
MKEILDCWGIHLKVDSEFNLFVISTSLHLFQVSLISRGTKKNVYVISDELSGLYDFSLLLSGRCVFTSFQDDYIALLKGVIWGRKRSAKINLYICNQNHAISSYFLNAYDVSQLILLDDGLVSYQLQSEKEKKLHNTFKYVVNSIFSLFGVKILSFGHGNNLKLPVGIRAKFVSLLNEFQSSNEFLEVIPFSKFVEYGAALEFIDEVIINSGEKKYSSLSFLSYQQSIDDSRGESGMYTAEKVVKHPRISKDRRPLIPYEFLIKGASEIFCGISSIYLVSKCFYGLDPVIVCKDEEQKKRLVMEALN